MTFSILQHWAQQQNDNNAVQLYALIDGLQYERHFRDELYYKEGCSPLFRQPEDARMAFAGPWLIHTAYMNEKELAEFCQLERQRPALSWILTQQDFFTLLEHLEQQLNIALPDGKIALFRYYDPRVLHRLPRILDEAQRKDFLGEIAQWYYFYEENYLSV